MVKYRVYVLAGAEHRDAKIFDNIIDARKYGYRKLLDIPFYVESKVVEITKATKVVNSNHDIYWKEEDYATLFKISDGVVFSINSKRNYLQGRGDFHLLNADGTFKSKLFHRFSYKKNGDTTAVFH